MRKLYSLLLRKLICNQQPCKKYYSYLYVTGDRATTIYSTIKPHIDFEDRLKDVKELEDNVKRRKLDINITELKELWDFMNVWRGYRVTLSENLKEVLKQLKALDKKENDDKIKSLNVRCTFIKDDLKQVTKNVWDLENNAVLKALKVPNYLHARTPDEDFVVETFKHKMDSGVDHLEVGRKLSVLDYFSSSNYYLKNKLALFEIFAGQYFVDEFKKCGFVPTSNTDFVRSVLVEGCTSETEAPDIALQLKDTDTNKKDKLYLAGGSSFMPFFGYHAKRCTDLKSRVMYVAQGRQYNPKLNENLAGLYSVIQSTAVELFVALNPNANVTEEFDELVDLLTNIYKSLDIHFQIVNVPASKLKIWESMRYSFQLYSPVHKVYIEVGNVSLISNYVSKRLRCQDFKSSEDEFLNVISGTAVRLPVLIATILETSTDEMNFPDAIKSMDFF